MIDVSLGQCKRAKQRVLYDQEGGLIELYRRLWDYRQAILDSNPGSTCILDVEETETSNTYLEGFMYVSMMSKMVGWKVVGD